MPPAGTLVPIGIEMVRRELDGAGGSWVYQKGPISIAIDLPLKASVLPALRVSPWNALPDIVSVMIDVPLQLP